MEKFLTSDEMHQLDLGNLNATIIKLELDNKKKDIKYLNLEAEVIKLKIALESSALLDLQKKQVDQKKKHKVFVDALKKNYDIMESDTWGFNPTTGELMLTKKGE